MQVLSKLWYLEKFIQFCLPFSNQTEPLCTLLLKKQRYRKCSGKVTSLSEVNRPFCALIGRSKYFRGIEYE